MGAQESKVTDENASTDVTNATGAAPPRGILSTPMTPLAPIQTTPDISLLDPRSPSLNIARTPLELVLASRTKTTQETTEILADDPRSPTIEFQRTPIVVGAVAVTPNSCGSRSRNFDNSNQYLLRKATANLIGSRGVVPPKLLDSSPIAVPHTINKRKSLVGVLETNVDFTETDLDAVIQQGKSDLNKTLPGRVTDDCVTPLTNKIESQMDALNLKESKPVALHFDDTREIEDMSEEAEQISEEAEDILEEAEQISDKIEESPADKILAPVPEESINITAHVKSFDRKLSTLIYEDESVHANPNIKLTKMRDVVRSPLKLRDLNGGSQKALSTKLRVSDRPRKLLEGSSRIPVLKDIHGRKKGVQCENTPPSQQRAVKGSRWDADATLII